MDCIWVLDFSMCPANNCQYYILGAPRTNGRRDFNRSQLACYVFKTILESCPPLLRPVASVRWSWPIKTTIIVQNWQGRRTTWITVKVEVDVVLAERLVDLTKQDCQSDWRDRLRSGNKRGTSWSTRLDDERDQRRRKYREGRVMFASQILPFRSPVFRTSLVVLVRPLDW